VGATEDDGSVDVRLARVVAERSDPEAESALCRRLFPRVRAYGLLHLGDEQDASELAQQVALVVIEALRAGKVREIDGLAAFVGATCRSTVSDWQKVERRRGALLERLGPSFASALEPAAPPAGKRLDDCLQRLGARARAIVVHTFYLESSADEIATGLGMSTGSVKVARHRALEHLHDCLGRES
jgi:RNA polymerase sigma-70 factor (ECF subfamily)